ncbi:MAG: SGNH/GDSL hydrolase family protein [Cyanobacteria bacterium]|nr:SGNH/GDSL hydrolase family protein [Cyanobacteriota bacterium]
MPNATITVDPVKPSVETPPPPSSGIVRSVIRHCAWGLVSLVVAVAALDSIFATAHIGEEEFAHIVPVVGFSHIPNKVVTFRAEGYSKSRTNSDGFRDSEWTLAKPPGTKRIAILGDSMAEGYQVSLDETFGKLLERKLNQNGKEKFEVMNFGMSGFSTVQELYCFKEKALKYKPDICILAYHVGDNEKNIYTPGAEEYLPRPYCNLDENGRLITDWSCLEDWKNSEKAEFYRKTEALRENRIWAVCTKVWLEISNCKLYKKVSKPIAKLMGQEKVASAPLKPVTALTETDIRGIKEPTPAASLAPYMPPALNTLADPAAASARYNILSSMKRFEVTGAVIDELNRLCQSVNCRLLVVALPAPNNSMLFYKELQLMQHLAKDSGFGYVDSARVFPSLAPMQESDYFYTIHFTPKGHALLANDLEKALLEQHLVSR